MGHFDHLLTVAQAAALPVDLRSRKNLGKQSKTCVRCGRVTLRRRGNAPQPFCGRRCAALSTADKTRKPRGVCLLCGKARPGDNQRGCSAKCAYLLRKLRTRKPRVCPCCHREYFSKGRLRLKFCSKRCMNVMVRREAYETFPCEHCGIVVTRRKIRTRPRTHKFCGRPCQSRYFVAERNSQWRGGSDPNRGAEWIKLAAAIRARDGHLCQRCGKAQADNKRRLDVDHIRPWRSFANKAEANALENLVALCSTCHKQKTTGAERRWLRGDRLDLLAYERSVKQPSLFAAVLA